MKISFILVLFTLSTIAKGQWAAAARELYKPIILSAGTIFAATKSKENIDPSDKNSNEWK